MPNLIDTLSVHWDLWMGRYRAFFPTTGEDRRACLGLLGETGGAGEADASAPDEEGRAPRVTLLAACQDTQNGEIIACLRLADARRLRDSGEDAGQYAFDRFGEERLGRVAVITQLAIQLTHLKTPAVTALISHCIIEVLKAGGQSLLMSCDPGHFSVYKRLGMRPIGSLHKTASGDFRIPMIFLPDQDYLSIIHSPVLPLLRGVNFRDYDVICQWYYQLVRENSELKIGAAFYPENEGDFPGHHAITEGLSEQGREAFLKNALVINCREDEVLIREHDGGKAFGFVSRGLVKVVIGGKTVVLLSEGDIFGEIAFILGSKRTALVVAASPDTEVVLFSESAIDRLRDEADKTTLWRNLARVLAQRVVVTNKLLE